MMIAEQKKKQEERAGKGAGGKLTGDALIERAREALAEAGAEHLADTPKELAEVILNA